MGRDGEGNQKGFCKDVGSTRKAVSKENVVSLLSGAGDLVTKTGEELRCSLPLLPCLSWILSTAKASLPLRPLAASVLAKPHSWQRKMQLGRTFAQWAHTSPQDEIGSTPGCRERWLESLQCCSQLSMKCQGDQEGS